MSGRWRRLTATATAVMVLASACGLDDGARVRNQDNVRDGSSEVDADEG